MVMYEVTLRVERVVADAVLDWLPGDVQRILALDGFEAALTRALGEIAAALRDFDPPAAQACYNVLNGTAIPKWLRQAAEHFWGFARCGRMDIARCIAECVQGREYFCAMTPPPGAQGAAALHCLRACWLALAPRVLSCADAAKAALAGLEACLCDGRPEAAALYGRISEILQQTGGAI